MSAESTREVMLRYFGSAHGDTSMMADDVVFTIMDTGEEHRTPQGILQMLNDFYHGTFEADVETTNTIFGDGQAVVEGLIVGKHTGTFAGVPATGKDVRVPICVVYDLENDKIKKGRVYVAGGVFMQQVGAFG